MMSKSLLISPLRTVILKAVKKPTSTLQYVREIIHSNYNMYYILVILLIHADKCNVTVPQDGLLINNSSISLINNTRTPGDEILYICRPGFVPQTTRRAVCQENGTWSPDPKELLCLVGEYQM